jgi:RNA polymerase sigma-70 factor, ECF subfamily
MIGTALMVGEGWVTTSEVAGEVLAVQRGDRDAFASLLTRYQNRLYRYLLRWTRETATAEDLFQQSWLKVLENIGRFDPKRNFEAWLFAVARNVAIDHLRRYRPESLDGPLGDDLPMTRQFCSDDPGALERAMQGERITLVQRALEAQPPADREVLTLRFEEEMKLEEIAEVLAVPLSTVKSRLGRAFARLRATCLRLRLEEMTP